MEARDASGKVVAADHSEVVAAGGWMSPLLALAMLAGLAVMSGAIWLIHGWAGLTVAVVGGLVALIAAGSLGFFMWGKQIGFNWHFTP